METTPCSSKTTSRCNFIKLSRRNLPYFLGHLVLVILVSLPTVFFIVFYSQRHPVHFSSNGTTSNSTNSKTTTNLLPTAKNNTRSDEGQSLECNSPLIPDQETGQCRPPCDWSTQSPLTQKINYITIIVGLWAALIATVITAITWASIKNLRKFPHFLRFYIMICCIVLANVKMIPIHKRPETTFCLNEKFWYPEGQSSTWAVIQGALTHYFCLAHSFWSMCFVANTYAVVVHHNRAVFKHPIKIHLMQSVLGWLVPAVVVASCLYFCQPGYKFYFMDLMSAGPASSEMAYFAISLPLTVTLGVSLCLLWSIVWHIRKARLDSTKRVIRAREERDSMRRVERQFLSMAFLILFVVGLVLALDAVAMNRARDFIHQAIDYFDCLQISKDCKSPSYNTILPLVMVVAPSFVCVAFFFLLFMNKDCRQIWINCFKKCKKIFELCKPAPGRIRADTYRSRCSSTLTVISDRRISEHFTADHVLKLTHPHLFAGSVTTVNMERPRSSTLSLLLTSHTRESSNEKIQEITSQNDVDKRSRCNSVPLFVANENVEDAEKINSNLSSLNSPSRDLSELGSKSSIISDTNSNTNLEREGFIHDIQAYSSKALCTVKNDDSWL